MSRFTKVLLFVVVVAIALLVCASKPKCVCAYGECKTYRAFGEWRFIKYTSYYPRYLAYFPQYGYCLPSGAGFWMYRGEQVWVTKATFTPAGMYLFVWSTGGRAGWVHSGWLEYPWA